MMRDRKISKTVIVVMVISIVSGVSIAGIYFLTGSSHTGYFNVGYTILSFQCTDENGESQIVKAAVWYPTTQAMTEHEYPYTIIQTLASRVALDAPLAREAAPYPLILFSHGYGGSGNASVFLTENLARQGFIVVSPDYPDDLKMATIDGQGDLCTFEEALEGVENLKIMDASTLLSYASYRFRIARAAIDKMLELNEDASSIFYDAIDKNAIGAGGHSFGALITLGIAGAHSDENQKDGRVRAALILSGPSFPFLENVANVQVPIMVMHGDNDEVEIGGPEYLRRLVYDYAQPPKFYLVIKQSTHFTFGNRPLMRFDTVQEGVESDHRVQTIINYSSAFFRRYLKNDIGAEEQLKAQSLMLQVYEKEF